MRSLILLGLKIVILELRLLIFAKGKLHFGETRSMATDDYIENLNRIRLLADQVKILDLLNPTSDTVNLLTEIIDRAKKIPELERLDFEEDLKIDNIEAEA